MKLSGIGIKHPLRWNSASCRCQPASSSFRTVKLLAAGWNGKGIRALPVNLKPMPGILHLPEDHDLGFGVIFDDKMVAFAQAAPFPHGLRNDDPASA